MMIIPLTLKVICISVLLQGAAWAKNSPPLECIDVSLLPNGMCSNYLQNTQFIHLQNDSVVNLKERYTTLSKHHQMLKVIIDLTSDPSAAKDLIPLTISTFTDVILSDKQVDIIVDSMQTSSFNICMEATQESLCDALIPQCIFDNKGSYLYHKRPCYESCMYVQNEVCIDQKPFFQMIKAIMKNGDQFDCNRFDKYNASRIKCHITDSTKALYQCGSSGCLLNVTSRPRRVTTTGRPIRVENNESFFLKYAAVFYVTGALVVVLIIVILFIYLRRRVKNQSVSKNIEEMECTLNGIDTTNNKISK